MQYPVRVENSPETPLAVVRRNARQRDLPTVVPEACGIVWNALKAQQLKGGRHVAVYLDRDINLEIGAEMDTPFAQTTELIASRLPAGRVATTSHFGPYGALGQAHKAVCDHCNARGLALDGINWEIYGHWEDAWNTNPSLIRTDVFYLLK